MNRPLRSIVGLAGLATAAVALCASGVAFWFVQSHREVVHVSAQRAEAEFSELRGRFSNQQPLLDMDRREASAVPAAPGGAAPLHSFHTIVFDRRGGERIVRIAVPYWFARRFAGRDGQFKWLGQLTFLDDTEFDPEAIHLSLDQVERRGPGLVADYHHPGGGQFISWVE